jgi:topoisomerase-4 subunit B
VPPLYRLVQGTKSAYARDDAHKDELLGSTFSGRGKVEISRFKGLGEMMPAQLKETTMTPGKRTLLQVQMAQSEAEVTARVVKELMGNKPEDRFNFITERAQFVDDDELDI